MRVKFVDVTDAFMFTDADPAGGNRAWIEHRTGDIHFQSDMLGDEEPLPDDIDDGDVYLAVPNRRDLGLGQRVAIAFAEDVMPNRITEVREIFSRSGAYSRIRSLLERSGFLQRWYDFSNEAEEAALRLWCREEGVDLIEDGDAL